MKPIASLVADCTVAQGLAGCCFSSSGEPPRHPSHRVARRTFGRSSK